MVIGLDDAASTAKRSGLHLDSCGCPFSSIKHGGDERGRPFRDWFCRDRAHVTFNAATPARRQGFGSAITTSPLSQCRLYERGRICRELPGGDIDFHRRLRIAD